MTSPSVAPPPMQVLGLEGSPTQIGEAHGEALRDAIRAHVERQLDRLLTGTVMRLDEPGLWALWASRLTANEAAAPELIEEMRGIARGAGVPFERIFLLNSLLDVENLRHPGCAAPLMGCTTFALPEEAGTGAPIIGQTYDLEYFRQEYGFVARLPPRGGPRQLLFTLAGMVGCSGLNEAGIGVVINYLSPRDLQPGKLHAVIVRQALGSRNLADALTAPMAGARSGGSHYLVADDAGNVVGVETTATCHALFYADGRPYGHTNHYLAPELKSLEVIRPQSIGSSIARYAALRRYLQRPDLDRAALKTMTRSHDSFPRSICAHGQAHEPDDLKGRTIAAMIFSLQERTMEICRGCACEGEYQNVML
jgi:isopenicillin-N N-acyltransferase-like protein